MRILSNVIPCKYNIFTEGCTPNCMGNGSTSFTFSLLLSSKPPTDSELWHQDNQPDGTFLIISKLHGKALDCGGQTQGSKLIVWDRHGGSNQRWRDEGNSIASMSGLVLDIEGSNKEPGAKVCL